MNIKQQMVASATLVMKITVIQIFIAIFFMCSLYAKEAKPQNVLERKITLEVNNVSLNKVIKYIKQQTTVDFSFSQSATESDVAITCSVKNKTLMDFLNQELGGYNIGYRLVNNQIVLFRNDKLTGNNQNPNDQSVKPSAADIIVTGVVYGDDGQTLPGVTIKEKGTLNAVSTDLKGYFSIKVKNSSAVLIVSSIGFTNQEITVGNQKTFKIKMVSNSTTLQDVVVVGYGTQKKINQTGSSSTIGTGTLTQSPVANISNSLAGRLPGVFASQAGGEPGHDESTVRIRGVGTFTGNTNPLYLVDGIEVTNYNNIDPNEIESLTVLKDATSTAVYGIRGANGVIIITTRRGKEGPPQVSYSFNQGINSFTALPHTISAVDFANGYNQAIINDRYTGGNAPLKYTPADIALFQSGADPIFHSNTDWRSILFKKNSFQSQHNINIRGGQKSVQYFISAGIFSQDGLFTDTKDVTSEFSAQSTFKRYNFRANFNFDITKRLKARLDVSTQTQNLSGNNNSNSDNTVSTKRIIADILRSAPTEGPGVLDGKLVLTPNGINNPYISLLASGGSAGGNGGLRREYDNTLNGTFRLDQDLDFITKGFKVHGDIALTTINQQVLLNLKQLTIYNALPAQNAAGYILVPQNVFATPEFKFSQPATPGSRRVTAELGFDYNRSFGNHNITGLLLYNQQKTYDPNLLYDIPKGYQAFVGRVTYAFKSRYLAEFDGGYNGTENFAPGKQFGFFPAFSAGWVPSEESFFPKNKIISFLKFRGSYGVVGNDNIGGARFLYIPTSYTYVPNVYYFGNVGSTLAGVTGVVEGKAGNANVTWERSKKTDIGTDMYLFSEKIKITADYFYEDRSNILSNPNTISNDAGIVQPAVNLGRMTNQGIEGEVTYSNNLKDFSYRVSANYSYAHNNIVFQDEVPNPNAYQNRTGQRFGQLYGIPVDGIYNTWEEVNDANRTVYKSTNNKIQPGDFKYRDVNGDGVIDGFDSVPIGYSNIPEISYGVTFGGSYKGFDFSILFQGVSHVSLGYTGANTNLGYGSPLTGGADYLVQAWSPARYAAGLPINFPRYTSSGGPNNLGGNFFTVDASYLRIKNAELGYSLKPSLLKKLGVRSARIYANANNLYTWDKVLPGIDPENAPTGDSNQVNYPLVRTVNFGINVNF